MNDLPHMLGLLLQERPWCCCCALLERGRAGSPAAGGDTSGVVSGGNGRGQVAPAWGFHVCNLGAASFPF